MSKIAITPNASGTGTFTIAAPNSNTDRTLTLPDAAGAVVIDEAGGGSVKIDSNGNMGIGTTNPAQKLHIYGTDQVIYNQSVGSGSTPVPGLSLNRSGATSGLASQSIQFDVGGGGGGVDIYTLREISAGGTLIIRTDNTSGTKVERMRIDSAGRVTMPYQPAFLAYNAPASFVTGSTIVWSSTAINRGSVYNTSNGRFTAPVSGLYQFFASVRIEYAIANTSYHRLAFFHNGSLIQWSLSRLNFHLNGYYSHASNDQVVAMSAGDYVEVKFDSSPSPITADAPNEHIFYGYLIG